MQTAVQFIDTARVGALGTAATAAVGATTINWLIICTRLQRLGLIAVWGCTLAHSLLVFVLYVIYLLRGRLEKLI